MNTFMTRLNKYYDELKGKPFGDFVEDECDGEVESHLQGKANRHYLYLSPAEGYRTPSVQKAAS